MSLEPNAFSPKLTFLSETGKGKNLSCRPASAGTHRHDGAARRGREIAQAGGMPPGCGRADHHSRRTGRKKRLPMHRPTSPCSTGKVSM